MMVLITEEKLASWEKNGLLREVGEAGVWRVSSAKHGNGVLQLRDHDNGTYWQSDGAQPHLIEVTFPQLTDVAVVAVLLNYGTDESYTPKKLAVLAGNTGTGVVECCTSDLEHPKGWLMMPLVSSDGPTADGRIPSMPVTTVQVLVTENHQNGRDTHVRGVRVYAHLPEPTYSTSAVEREVTLR
jgi:anaphase-promoting complex subunit 10